MDRHTVGAVVNTIVMGAYASVAAWRGFHRRRSLMRTRSWIGFTLTLLTGLILLGFGFAVASGVDQHAAWVGIPRSNTRTTWALASLASLVAGVLLSVGALGWFGYGDPTKQFPGVDTLRGRRTKASAAASR